MSSESKKAQQQYYTDKYRDAIESMRGEHPFVNSRDVLRANDIEDTVGNRTEVGTCLGFLADTVDWIEPFSASSGYGGRTYRLSPPEGGDGDA